MLSAGAVLTITCAIAAAVDLKHDLLNNTNIDKRVLNRLTTFLESNKTIGQRELALLNKTALTLDLEDEFVTKFTKLVKQRIGATNVSDVNTSISDITVVTTAKSVTEDKSKRESKHAVEESPDYASSVVLASDLLALTTSVGKVKNKACREQGYRFLDGLLLNKRWALKMFDASAKSPQGLLFGSSYHLGNFDECVGIDDSEDGVAIEGQYCLATIKWKQDDETKKVRTGRGETLRWAVCVPSACNAEAVETFVSDVLANTVGNAIPTGVLVTEKDCYTRRPLTVTNLDVGYLSLILSFMAILLFSTIYEAYSLRRGNNKSSVIHDLVISFSVINNLKKILSTRQNNSLGLECVTGIKTLAMVFIIAGHACLFIGSGPVMDAEAWDRLVRDPANAFMLNNALLVDTFLMLSAFLFCRLLLIELDKRRGKLNVIPILLFRYIRLTPAYMIVILFYMTWLPKIGEGPLWENRMLLEQERCQESWWTNILYINNYVNTDKLCMFQSWYLSVDTQLFFIAPVFIYSLWRWRKLGPTLLGLGLFVSLLIPSIITYKDRLDATILFFAKEFTDIVSNYYFKEAYIRTHMKMTPYFMGLLTGYILHRIQTENYQLSKLMKVFGWTTSIVLGTVTTFSISLFYQEWYQYNTIEAAAYISLHKLTWGIANGWLIIACVTGNGGLFTKLLTWKFLVPLSRLTYCAYLVNGIVELYYVGQLRHPLHVTFFTVLANAISHLMLTFTLAMLLCLTFESPIHGIEKILLAKFVRPAQSDNARRQVSLESSRNTSQSKLDT
ncbi:nose resistant to fluoxetine protein 6-like [Hyposmocoma kahamanoa]|uniref:nose resistant to fluoxetine protein 6-like n=1 Tax=Hyposmocoma kahamanoa TaxID=1477025 RepID=UPI000E6D95E9|nr:nose resistant to fluoxetine protein 6-like [Hyposmocoma kahamanoa]